MVNVVVLVEPDIYQPVIAASAIGIDHLSGIDFASNDALQRLFRAIRHNVGIHLASAFGQTEDNRFATRSSAPFATYPTRAELRFVEFECPAQLDQHRTELVQAATQKQVYVVDRTHAQARQASHIRGH